MINFCGSVLRRVDQHKHLGLFISQDLCWHSHIEMISNKASNRLLLLKRLKYVLDRHTLQILYKSFIRPLLEYASAVWDNCTEYEKHKLESIQYKAALVVSGAMKGTGRTNLYEELAWETLESRRARRKLVIFHGIFLLSSTLAAPLTSNCRKLLTLSSSECCEYYSAALSYKSVL